MSALNAKSIQKLARDVAHDAKGTIAIIFSLSIFVVFLAAGLAIDVGRVVHADRKLAAAIDAAALAAAKGLRTENLTDDEVRAIAREYFEVNMHGGGTYANVQSVSVSIDRDKNSVAINVDSEVPMLFGNFAGVPKMALPKASVAIYDTKDIEIGLQLDVTQSMCNGCDKIAALKDAVAGTDGMLDILLPDDGTTNEVRIGLAPFSSGVNAGAYVTAVTGGRNPSDRCVYERVDSSQQATDAAPVGNARFKVKSELSNASVCPGHANKVVAITDDKAALRTAVRGLTTNGSTAGHLGAAWAWGLVSPNWAQIWGGKAPAPYKDGRTQKYVILMTDGEYNTVGGVMSNGNTTASNKFAQDTCTAMKDKGVVVYTIGFDVKSNAVKNQLKSCASGITRFYDASNGTALRSAFRAIAEEINSLRLSS
jgi:Flp pilus assembly protein TadG